MNLVSLQKIELTLDVDLKERECNSCHIVKPIDQFGKSPVWGKRNKDCKACRAITNKKYNYAKRNH